MQNMPCRQTPRIKRTGNEHADVKQTNKRSTKRARIPMLRKNKKRARMANCSIERQKATDESVEVSDYLVRDDALKVSKRKRKCKAK